MSRTFRHGERRIRIRGIKRDPKDMRRIARALIELAQAQAEADANAEKKERASQTSRRHNPGAAHGVRGSDEAGEEAT